VAVVQAGCVILKMTSGYFEHDEDERTSLMGGNMAALEASGFLPTVLPRTNKLVSGYYLKSNEVNFRAERTSLWLKESINLWYCTCN
jgi:hypothetical protein